ncbi:DUF6153 family protein [Streptomyces sp. NBC_01506]|uniref:DUF6153 family protein n=1 Tax=Streptomyces sp. NBC_01506 TaxID=2903887 RepID=UPI00386EF4CC
MSGYGRAGGAVGRLLLVVVLALGVFAMHTVGHPDAAHASVTGPMAHTSAEPAPPHPVAAPAPSPSHEQVMTMDRMAMDMTSLCVAVLSTWAIAALALAAFARWPGRFTDPLAGLAVEPRSNSPPRTPDLASLSVLRI